MSHKATSWAVQQRGLKPAVKVLLWHLADRHNVDNGCFPNQSMLADDCEMSRATVNRHLDELEQAGLIRRIKRIDPDTRRQLSTRYVLAFEEGFEPLHVEGRVSNLDTEPCLKKGQSRVSKIDDSVSHSCETLTCKGTSKEPGTPVERELFNEIWEVFPRSPYAKEVEALHAFNDLSDSDKLEAMRGAELFAAWFREEAGRRKEPIADRMAYAPVLAKWLRNRGWVEALTLKVKARPSSEAAAALAAVEYVDRVTQSELFEACEKMRGKLTPPSIQRYAFDKSLVEQARKDAA